MCGGKTFLKVSAVVIGLSGGLTGEARSQSKAPTTPARIEPGLETAVDWKWRVLPSDETRWGLPIPEDAAPPPEVIAPAQSSTIPGMPASTSVTPATPAAPAPRPTEYEVKKGDALILIAKKFGMSVQQLKTFNNLEKDTIRIGQVMKIPTLEEMKTIAPPPPPPEPEPKPEKKAKDKPKPAPPAPVGDPSMISMMHNLLQQVFLDREGFATGPIDGNPGAVFSTFSQLYRGVHEDATNMDQFLEKARKTVGEPLIKYTLKPEDFRFILRNEPGKSGKRSSAKDAAPPTYPELVASPLLVYRSPWEFVAERFHADETFLRQINRKIRGTPTAGTEFVVPNVIPFEVEKTVEGSLQPAADAQNPVTAAIVEISRLEISRGGKLVAVMPLGLARPDLRGRGSWTILEAIAKPKLATLRESRDGKSAMPTGAPTAPDGLNPGVSDSSSASGSAARAVLASEEFLAAGPNNPVGIIWINLAKAKSTEPLPYGLHGTSIPGRMRTQEGIGGIRLANWDIARAVKLLPAGTALHWK